MSSQSQLPLDTSLNSSELCFKLDMGSDITQTAQHHSAASWKANGPSTFAHSWTEAY